MQDNEKVYRIELTNKEYEILENLQEVWPWEHDAIDKFRHYTGPKPEGY